jgi:hypothetical protein
MDGKRQLIFHVCAFAQWVEMLVTAFQASFKTATMSTTLLPSFSAHNSAYDLHCEHEQSSQTPFTTLRNVRHGIKWPCTSWPTATEHYQADM